MFAQRLAALHWSAVHERNRHEECRNHGLHDDCGVHSCRETERNNGSVRWILCPISCRTTGHIGRAI
jgi:hypothetical protein